MTCSGSSFSRRVPSLNGRRLSRCPFPLLATLLFTLHGLAGCGDVKLPEIELPGKAKNETPPPVVNEPSAPQMPAIPQPPPMTPEQVIAEVLSKNSMDLRDADLERLAKLPSGLESISEFRLASSTLSGQGLKHLKSFPALKSLDLQAIVISDGQWGELAGLSTLESLNLSHAAINDSGLISVGKLTGLKTLDLSSTTVSDGGFVALSGLSALTELHIDGTQMNGSGLEALGDKGAKAPLQIVSASNTNFGYQGFIFLKEFSTLEELEVSGSSVTNGSMEGLKRLSKLRIVRLPDNQIGDDGVKDLSASKQLEILDLTGNTAVSDATLTRLRTFKQLKQLNISGTLCTLKGIEALKKALPDCEIRFDQKVY